jgi:hypothetical protein
VSIDIQEEALTLHALEEHAVIPIAFAVDRILEATLVDGGLGGMALTETVVTDRYVKDYDAIEGSGPARWPERFDISSWGLICVRRDGARAGGAVIAFNTPGLRMLGGRDDVAVLWDIRAPMRPSVGEDLAQGGGEGVRLAHAAVFAAEESVVAAREGDGCRPEPSGHGNARAASALTAPGC